MVEIRKSFCRNCSAVCSMDLTVEGNRIVKVTGDGSQSLYGGYFCPKGHMSAEFHNGAENRLTNSLRRKPGGDFEAVDAEAAMDEIAIALQGLIAEHGPRCVAFFMGTGANNQTLATPLAKSLLDAIGSPKLFSTMTIDQSAKWVTMLRMGSMRSGKQNPEDTDVFLIAGGNPMVSHQAYPYSGGRPGAPGKFFLDAKKRGAKLIVVDPRRTETARFADLLIQPLPGEDASLFAGLVHLILKNGEYNHAFVERFVTQVDVLRAAVADYTPDYVAARAGVPASQLEQAAQMFARARRPFAGSGTGPSMGLHSNLADHLIETLNALCGGYRRAGDTVRNPGSLATRTYVEAVNPPRRTWETGVKLQSGDAGRMFGEFPSALIPQEILSPGPDKLRALIVFAGNPAMALGDPDKTLAAFKDLNLLVCLDPRLNETAQLAHYVIAPTLPFERHDLTLVSDTSFPQPFAQYAPPIISPPAGVIDDWAFFWGLGKRLGCQLTLKNLGYGVPFDAVSGGLPLDMQTRPEPQSLIRWMCSHGTVSFDELMANPGGIRTKVAPQIVQAAAEDDGARLELCPADIAQELRALRNEPMAGLHYRYRLTVRRLLTTMNSAYRDADRSLARYPTNWAYMNPQDLEDEGLPEGTSIEIESEFGRIMGIVKPEESLRRGVVSMSHLFGSLGPSNDPIAQRGAHTGWLTSLERYIETINFMPRFTGIPVNVRALSPVDAQVGELQFENFRD